jgi:hypothetical protein
MTAGTDSTPTRGATAPAPGLNGAFLTSYDRRRDARDPTGGAARARVLQLQAAAPEGDGPRPEAVLDDNNLLPFAFLRTGDRVGRCVVKIERADRAAGTGFLVAPDILLTNHHVLPDPATAAGAMALANYEAAPPGDPAGRPARVPLRPDALFVTNAELDFTFCGVSGLDHLGSVAVERDSLLVMPSEYVNIIQHPRGRPKEVALQDSRVVKVDHVVIHYSCDTEPGSSGSPVFNNRWRLVALHHASVATDAAAGGRAAAGLPAGRRYLNEGIRLSAIALWLEGAEANGPATREPVARLRRIFADLDPGVGYFGALGQKAGDRSAAELVVDAYRARGDRLDVAYWDAAHLAESGPDRLPELGWAVAGMGLDVWLLAGLPPELAGALAAHLDAHFGLDYRVVPAPGTTGGPLVALVRREAARRVEWRDGGATAGDAARPHLLIHVAGTGTPGYRLALVPAGRRDRDGDADADGPRRPIGPLPRSDRPGAAAADLIVLGDALDARDLHALAGGAPALRAAIGPDGGLALRPVPASRVETLFVSPNLDATVGDAGPPPVVADDRRWPAALAALGGARPIAARLVLGPAPAPAPTPAPTRRGARLRADAPGAAAPHLHPPLAPFRTPGDDEDDDGDPALDPGILALLDDEGLEHMLRSLLDALRSRKTARANEGEGDPVGISPDAG